MNKQEPQLLTKGQVDLSPEQLTAGPASRLMPHSQGRQEKSKPHHAGRGYSKGLSTDNPDKIALRFGLDLIAAIEQNRFIET